MHPEKESFKVNAQRSKPYFGVDFHESKQAFNLTPPGALRFREVELTTLSNKCVYRLISNTHVLSRFQFISLSNKCVYRLISDTRLLMHLR